jgi:dihydropteroate synthase
MGVLNVTPDSFSDGGRYLDPARALEHGRRLVAQGADLVDVGAEVAAAAVQSGAVLVNDVSGGLADESMLSTVADLGVACVLMHWRAHAEEMQRHTCYDDVVTDVSAELRTRLEAAAAAGVDPARVAVDPGIGFSKTADQNWDVLAGLERLHDLGHPVLVATSRKRFLGSLLADASGGLRVTEERKDGTTATSALAASAGAWCIRAHDVRATLDAVRVAHRWAAGAGAGRG